MRLIIGLTGLRGVGKSEVALMMVKRGFIAAHAFNGGKAATVAYFRHLGASEETAHEMVYGRLKDVPSPLLPGNATPRLFMEKLGRWFGVEMGPDWTLGAELDRLGRTDPDKSVVAESLVYEDRCLRSKGGIVIRVIRPDHVGPVGCETDRVQAEIMADHTLVNDGCLTALDVKVGNLLAGIGA